MNQKSIRWKQRFENYTKAIKNLQVAKEIKKPSKIEQAGLIQFFEVSFELAWKVLKDYLESDGFIVKSPREAIKLAYQNDIITHGEIWLDALQKRNLASHTYDETILDEFWVLICDEYFPQMYALYEKLSREL